jgi:methyltransferase (TIGR00027 family)
MSPDAVLRDISDTALVPAVNRARETGRPRPLFRDPYAGMLAGERGQRLARTVRARLVCSGNIVRTAVFDELILRTIERDRAGCVLNLGAGLDTRPYRLALPADLRWVEADLPGILGHKAKLLAGEQPRCRLERMSADLADTTARRRLLDQVAAGQPVLVVSEGLVPYLTHDDVTCLASDLAARPGFRWWAMDLASPLFIWWANRIAGRRLSAAGASFQFAPEDGPGFFRPLGWEPVEIRSSWLEQRRLGREPGLMRAAWALSPPRHRNAYRDLGLFVLLRRQPGA